MHAHSRLGLACVRPVAALLAILATATMADPLSISGVSMGTTYTVKVSGRPPSGGRAALASGIERILGRVDRLVSTWREDSEISRFNSSRATEWYPVSAETSRLVGKALAVSRLSEGAFDITVAPLLELWGFAPHPPVASIPSQWAIDRTLLDVGFELLRVRSRDPALRKTRPGVRLDLSGIAPGHAVDEIAAWLEQRGAQGYLVELGGELRGKGVNPAGAPWRVAIESPGGSGLEPPVVALGDAAIATSAGHRNFIELEGKRFAHVLDPTIGRPVSLALASASVIASTATEADALATALLALGPERGTRLALARSIAAYFIVRTKTGLTERSTPAFDAYRIGLP